jgi:hypothetical protein
MGTLMAAAVSSAIWLALEFWRNSPHPNRIHFRTRTLLIVVTLFCLMMGLATAIQRWPD